MPDGHSISALGTIPTDDWHHRCGIRPVCTRTIQPRNKYSTRGTFALGNRRRSLSRVGRIGALGKQLTSRAIRIRRTDSTAARVAVISSNTEALGRSDGSNSRRIAIRRAGAARPNRPHGRVRSVSTQRAHATVHVIPIAALAGGRGIRVQRRSGERGACGRG